jgi:hypothetical protein
VAVLLLAGAGALPLAQEFADHLPAELPSVGAWEKVSGSAELPDGSASLHYEFYVNPKFGARYEVVRYRIVGWDKTADGTPYAPTERLQWQAGRTEMRRYECVPAASRCVWKEMERGSAEYRRETPVIIWVLSVHNRLLQQRDKSR